MKGQGGKQEVGNATFVKTLRRFGLGEVRRKNAIKSSYKTKK